MTGQSRKSVVPGITVDIVLKKRPKNRKAYSWHCEGCTNEI
ncbi:uncharacterized protein YwbE [Metabacillus malikii]|uniref:Uncharacterized protein YwbE n=1 Tax=Metabacillus malikii TaxID=1504265 RepID=A0ABT9ZHT9_9BACI|nr:uncharacterized protein YwbE [Metabacillus malikii]